MVHPDNIIIVIKSPHYNDAYREDALHSQVDKSVKDVALQRSLRLDLLVMQWLYKHHNVC